MSWRICVCTGDGLRINQHFGHCEACAVYCIDESGAFSLLEERQLQAVDSSCEHADALRQKAEKIADCQYVLCEKVGNHAVRILAMHGITALEYSGEIEAALPKLANYLRGRQGIKGAAKGG